MELNDEKVIAELFKQISMKLKKNIQNAFSDFGLTFPQLMALALLKENGEMKIGEISDKMGLTNSTVSGIIDRLERMEFVKRVRNDEDRRVVHVGLTEKTKHFYDGFEKRLDDSFADLFHTASTEDLKDITKGLAKLNRILDDMDI